MCTPAAPDSSQNWPSKEREIQTTAAASRSTAVAGNRSLEGYAATRVLPPWARKLRAAGGNFLIYHVIMGATSVQYTNVAAFLLTLGANAANQTFHNQLNSRESLISAVHRLICEIVLSGRWEQAHRIHDTNTSHFFATLSIIRINASVFSCTYNCPYSFNVSFKKKKKKGTTVHFCSIVLQPLPSFDFCVLMLRST